jgi:lipopolysaccharide transport system ATP-binding protein
MSDLAIKVEDVGKLYRLGEVGTGTLSQDLKRWWAVTRGNEDPFAKIGETNDRTIKGESEFVWALKNINFEVKQGEVLGIIGRNGAGKSTLLKLLSKVTTPSTGSIKINGRIASLLEVGTGFHPDLTGRENIFLNGAILGMNRVEITKKFDEIVSFSGVARYIDTPVKRYSSGMYVRLAFAVAAHLESEILIVDEVLAVGDADFQKKCLGRMKDVSAKEGRTVLFVSHNMGAIKGLCNTGILLENGHLRSNGLIDQVISTYFKKEDAGVGKFLPGRFDSKEKVVVEEILIKNQYDEVTESFNVGDDLVIDIKLISKEIFKMPNISVAINWVTNTVTAANTLIDGSNTGVLKEGSNNFRITFKKLTLLPQEYYIRMALRMSDGKTPLMTSKEIGHFAVVTRLRNLGIEGSLAEETAHDSASPLIPYEWDFGNGNIQSFNILDNVKR